MEYQWTNYAILALLSSVLSLMLFFYVFRRKRVPGSNSFMILMLALSLWSICEFTHILFTDFDTIIFWSKFSYFGIVVAPIAWFDFSLNYTGKNRLLSSRQRILALMIIPSITLIMVFTNEYHSLIWDNIVLMEKNSIVYYVKDYGPWFYINLAYSYLMLILGTFYLIDPFSMSFSLYKKQKLFLLLGILLPWTANGIYIYFGPPIYSLDITPLTFLVSSSIILYALFHHGFLDIIPIAQKNILENINESVIVLDFSNRILYINKSTTKLIGKDSEDIIGTKIERSMPEWSSLIDKVEGDLTASHGMSFQEKIGEKYYECNISLLKQNNKIYGSLIIIRDVTMSVSYENRIKNMNEHLRIINKILRHDISNHLTAASLSIEMLEMGDVELRDRAQRSISRSLDLINRMKTLEMVISGHGQLKGYRLSDIMRDIIKNYPNIDFNINGDCTALADDAIVSVIDNLVNNAILHGGTEKIDIEIEKREGFCIINVIDYGKGIPAHIKDHIYNNEYSYGENKGTGIGLFIVKKTVERYGGDIKVTDNEPNGTKFTLILKKDNKSF